MRHFLWLVTAVVALVAVNVFLRWEPNSRVEPLREIPQVFNFSDCAALGFPVMESYPRQCRANGITYVEEVPNKPQPEPNKDTVTRCEPAQRGQDFCAQIYEPVCGKVNIQCITTPCDPIEQTFGNSCEACKNGLVESYKPGACPEK